MKNSIMMITVLMALGCAQESSLRTYDNNDLELVAGNAARLTCSCLFVMEMSEEFCRAWTKASPDVTRFSVDTTAKTVEASAFVTWAARARFVDAKRGCILE